MADQRIGTIKIKGAIGRADCRQLKAPIRVSATDVDQFGPMYLICIDEEMLPSRKIMGKSFRPDTIGCSNVDQGRNFNLVFLEPSQGVIQERLDSGAAMKMNLETE